MDLDDSNNNNNNDKPRNGGVMNFARSLKPPSCPPARSSMEPLFSISAAKVSGELARLRNRNSP